MLIFVAEAMLTAETAKVRRENVVVERDLAVANSFHVTRSHAMTIIDRHVLIYRASCYYCMNSCTTVTTYQLDDI